MQEIKIVLSGLDNAGKSSMLLGLKKLYNFEEDLKKLKPTIRIDYFRKNFMNLNLNYFDMGGQKKYRDSYLKHPIYFDSLNSFIYLIDIQDETRFSESIEFMTQVLNILTESDYDKSIPINICFSKADYDYYINKTSEFNANILMLNELILKTYPKFKFQFYSTSIFNLFSIIEVVSTNINKFIEHIDNISELVEIFSKKYNIIHSLLFDQNGMVIFQYSESYNATFEENYKKNNIISSNLEFFKQLEENKINLGHSIDFDEENSILCFSLCKRKNNDIPANYYISFIIPRTISLNLEIQELINQILKFI